jgi:hypothetical protein
MKTTRTTVLAILISISLLATNLSQAFARREPPPPKTPVCDLGCKPKPLVKLTPPVKTPCPCKCR